MYTTYFSNKVNLNYNGSIYKQNCRYRAAQAANPKLWHQKLFTLDAVLKWPYGVEFLGWGSVSLIPLKNIWLTTFAATALGFGDQNVRNIVSTRLKQNQHIYGGCSRCVSSTLEFTFWQSQLTCTLVRSVCFETSYYGVI